MAACPVCCRSHVDAQPFSDASDIRGKPDYAESNTGYQKTRHIGLNTRPAGLEDKSNMSENIKGKFGGLKNKFSLSRKKPPVDILIETVEEPALDSSVEPSVSRLSKYKPLLENIVINGLLNIAEDKLNDDIFVESVFTKAYELLPAPVRMVVKREWCLSYLQSRKTPLLVKLQLYRDERSRAEEPAALPDKEHIAQQVLPPAIP